jgi:hypothetical protein
MNPPLSKGRMSDLGRDPGLPERPRANPSCCAEGWGADWNVHARTPSLKGGESTSQKQTRRWNLRVCVMPWQISSLRMLRRLAVQNERAKVGSLGGRCFTRSRCRSAGEDVGAYNFIVHRSTRWEFRNLEWEAIPSCEERTNEWISKV